MSRLIETIHLLEGKFRNLAGHQQRVDDTFQSLYHAPPSWRLGHLLEMQPYPKNGLHKCRIVYDKNDVTITFSPYKIHPVRSLKIVEDNTISYPFKWEDRSGIEALLMKKENCDDILIVKNGMVTDCSFANVAFKRGNDWITPSTFLLNGTMRQNLLSNMQVREMPVHLQDIHLFSAFKLINAMVGFDFPESDVSNIV